VSARCGTLAGRLAYGGDPADAFHVVAPSLPGFGFSVPLSGPGCNHARIALAWAELMRRLGYERYGAQGGDTGHEVSPELGRIAPDQVLGVHINGGLAYPIGADELDGLTEVEQARLAAARRLRETGTGYADLQSTRPLSVGYGLHDSPVGQLAWVVEKFWEWTDPTRALPDEAVGRDHLLTNVMLYWLTGSGASSAHLYYENRVAPNPPPAPSGVPTDRGLSHRPGNRRLAERQHHVVHWSEFDRGGHFAAMEAPDLLVDDVRAFFRRLR
jgi:pimeloyl-ACP methyl ester carboxylesterase